MYIIVQYMFLNCFFLYVGIYFQNLEKLFNVVRCILVLCDCLCYRLVNYNECENKYNVM